MSEKDEVKQIRQKIRYILQKIKNSLISMVAVFQTTLGYPTPCYGTLSVQC